MKIASGLELVPVTAMAMGKPDNVFPVLLSNAKEAVLVDAGYPGRLEDLIKGFANANVEETLLSTVILTHQDIDHIGGMPGLLRHLGRSVNVLAHELEKPYIQGERRLIKITDELLAGIDHMFPPKVPEQWRRAFKALLESPPRTEVHRIIRGGDKLPYGGGIVVIDTPGHTPGHISLYHLSSKTLIAGDALVVSDGKLKLPAPELAVDYGQAVQSLQVLANYDIERVVCYHGGLYDAPDLKERIAELAETTELTAHAASPQSEQETAR
ncbi:MBL fold metallo-hydrolase [Paenibacillus xylaniclasticus]|uniref:MBL fold metallo-hydrolase n=1 Tax=Paenibacillus xylaniclasticus TaxID=588083 RepID=UPI000FDAB044|nr:MULTISPECIES: MBL fold metallo-hydrolase [Paenibacillus]GFN31739.1 hydrolase [Paenibacillus curdlanolyticus]